MKKTSDPRLEVFIGEVAGGADPEVAIIASGVNLHMPPRAGELGPEADPMASARERLAIRIATLENLFSNLSDSPDDALRLRTWRAILELKWCQQLLLHRGCEPREWAKQLEVEAPAAQG